MTLSTRVGALLAQREEIAKAYEAFTEHFVGEPPPRFLAVGTNEDFLALAFIAGYNCGERNAKG